MDDISSKEAYQSYNHTTQNESNAITADSIYQQLGFNKTKEEVMALPQMSSRFPITIVSSSDMNKNAPIKGDWYSLQKQWPNQNPSSLIFKAQSGHFIQIDRPILICEQLKKLVEKATSSSK